MSPDQTVNAHPARVTESKQGYALRLLNIAYAHVTNASYERCIAIVQKLAAGKTGVVEDVLSNIQIDLHAEKLKVIGLLKSGGLK